MREPRLVLPVLKMIDASYQRQRGKPLGSGFCPPPLEKAPQEARLEWVHDQAPFMLLAQDVSADPVFIYTNASASHHFGYTPEEFLSLPSRLSATAEGQEDRNAAVNEALTKGARIGYGSVRVTKAGKLFRLRDGELFLLHDKDDARIGMGALVWPTPY
ncbi:MEKHLA domain-containing protein [Myxococcus sp. AM011]|uniref:MEKHLA domain-containing protein n=1 Tax=Myxococcus sp. AM011 TaxID=2745200 RepID=UPI001596136C|nr:MEKHLA domain-containing protein [Myxococcus sp. AM011]NVJ25757.1 MEKHLA domain-containing protein [Myxococcus sp. AM011]